MTLTAAGRLLINTPTESTFTLDVNGTGRFSSNLRTDGVLFWNGSVGALSYGSGFVTMETNSATQIRLVTNGTTALTLATNQAATFSSSVTATSATLSGPLNINGSYIRGKTVTGTANGTNAILGVFLGYPGGISGTVEVFAMAGIIAGGSISSRILTFNFSGGNQAGGGGADANVSNSVLGSVASGFAGSTNIDSLSASITSLTVDSFNISISNTITGTQITAPTYYIQVTYGLHGNASIS